MYTQRILLPLEIINHDLDNQEFVYVVDQAQNKAFKRKISIGKVADNQVEVVSGLNVGEVVVSAGQNKLSDGSLITIK
jgi:multidrug efflux pump subunit AcrA (membrane-fusion protein)